LLSTANLKVTDIIKTPVQ